MHLHIETLIQHYGYFGVAVILLLEMVGIPFPAETTLTLSGIEWTRGAFKLVPLLLAAGIGNVVGSTIAYGIGRFLGRPVIVRFGRYIGITNERLDKANEVFAKYESAVVLFAKFIAGIRVLIPYLAGINKMPFSVFSLFNSISALIWALTFIVLGKYIGIEWTRYHKALHQYMVPVLIVLVIVVAAYVVVKMRRKRRAK